MPWTMQVTHNSNENKNEKEKQIINIWLKWGKIEA